MLSVVNQLLAYATVGGHALLLVVLIAFAASGRRPNAVLDFFGRYGILFAWLTALAAVIASLFYSEVAGFAPCALCWYQRIFMYPNAVILGIAWFRKDIHGVFAYSFTLAVIGAVIALYHNYLYYGGTPLLPCSASAAATCTQRFVFEFGYITIPLMSLTGFALMLAFLGMARRSNSRQSQ